MFGFLKHRSLRKWGILACLVMGSSFLVGCPKSQIIKPDDNPNPDPGPRRPADPPAQPPPVARSSQPVIKFLAYQPSGRVRYRVYNTSDRTFPRLLISIRGYGCSGRASRWLAVYKRSIRPGSSRTLLTRVSSSCRRYQIRALSVRARSTRLAVKIVRFRRGVVYYYVRNRSLRRSIIGGILVRIHGTGCRTPSGEKHLSYFYRHPLNPGTRLNLRTKLYAGCRRVRVSAQKKPRSMPNGFAPDINPFGSGGGGGGGSQDNPFGVNNNNPSNEF